MPPVVAALLAAGANPPVVLGDVTGDPIGGDTGTNPPVPPSTRGRLPVGMSSSAAARSVRSRTRTGASGRAISDLAVATCGRLDTAGATAVVALRDPFRLRSVAPSATATSRHAMSTSPGTIRSVQPTEPDSRPGEGVSGSAG